MITESYSIDFTRANQINNITITLSAPSSCEYVARYKNNDYSFSGLNEYTFRYSYNDYVNDNKPSSITISILSDNELKGEAEIHFRDRTISS